MNAVFDYLLSKGCIRNQKTFAKAISSTPANISKALKGDTKVLTDNFCRRIQKAFGEISAEWLISGTGEMVVIDSNKIATEQLPLPDYSSLVNATIAAMDSTIASLKREIADKDITGKAALEAKDEAIASLKRELTTKDALIKTLRQQVSDLSFALSALKEKSISGYPFTMGVADDASTPMTNKSAKTPAKFPSSRK